MTSLLSKLSLATSLALALLLGACEEDEPAEDPVFVCRADVVPATFMYKLEEKTLTLTQEMRTPLVLTRLTEGGDDIYDVWVASDKSQGNLRGRTLLTFGKDPDTVTVTGECFIDGELVATVEVESRAVYTPTTIQTLDDKHVTEELDLDEDDGEA